MTALKTCLPARWACPFLKLEHLLQNARTTGPSVQAGTILTIKAELQRHIYFDRTIQYSVKNITTSKPLEQLFYIIIIMAQSMQN